MVSTFGLNGNILGAQKPKKYQSLPRDSLEADAQAPLARAGVEAATEADRASAERLLGDAVE